MIRQIVVMDNQRGIAKNGDQPVHIAADLAYFRDKTTNMGGNVLMGRTTFEVIGLLENRRNFIATRDLEPIEGATVVADVSAFLRSFTEDMWIVGGAKIYELTLDMAEELYVTEIDADFGCDQFYPDFLQAGFALAEQGDVQVENGVPFRFCVYKRA